MNNYLLFGHILKCSVIPKSQVHPALFRGANKRFKRIPHAKIAGKILTKPLSEDKWAAKISRTNQKRADQAKKLKEMGYEFEAPELKTASAPVGIEAAEDVEKTPEAVEAPSTTVESAPIAKDEVAEAAKPAEQDIDDGVESLDGELAVGKFSKIIPKETVPKGNQRTKKPSKPKKKARARA
jgi:nucleolar protein 15